MKKPNKIRRNTRKQVENTKQISLNSFLYFPSEIFSIDLSDYLNITRKVSKEYLEKNTEELNDLYPVKMTGAINYDERLQDFCDTILNIGWNVLDQQGYDMRDFRVIFTSMWVQQHHKYSLMEHHVHGGDQLVGFYFLNAPKDGSKPIFYEIGRAHV